MNKIHPKILAKLPVKNGGDPFEVGDKVVNVNTIFIVRRVTSNSLEVNKIHGLHVKRLFRHATLKDLLYLRHK